MGAGAGLPRGVRRPGRPGPALLGPMSEGLLGDFSSYPRTNAQDLLEVHPVDFPGEGDSFLDPHPNAHSTHADIY